MPFAGGVFKVTRSGIMCRVTASDLDAEMRAHLAEPFPDSVEKGEDYGEVDAVMIGADIYGWALAVRRGSSLSSLDARGSSRPLTNWSGR